MSQNQAQSNDDDFVVVDSELTDTSYTYDIDISSGETYQFRVKARNSFGSSSYSSTLNIIALVGTIPSKPNAPKTKSLDNYKVKISWDLPSDDGGLPITGY